MAISIGSFAIQLSIQAAQFTAGLEGAVRDLENFEKLTGKAARSIDSEAAKLSSNRINLDVRGLDDLAKAQAEVAKLNAVTSAQQSLRLGVTGQDQVERLTEDIRKVSRLGGDKITIPVAPAVDSSGFERARTDVKSLAATKPISVPVLPSVVAAAPAALSTVATVSSAAAISETASILSKIPDRVNTSLHIELDEQSQETLTRLQNLPPVQVQVDVPAVTLPEIPDPPPVQVEIDSNVDEWSAAVYDAIEQLGGNEIDVGIESNTDEWSAAVYDAIEQLNAQTVDIPSVIDTPDVPSLPKIPPIAVKVDLQASTDQVKGIQSALEAAPAGFGRRLLDTVKTAKDATTASLASAYNNFTPRPIKFALDKSVSLIGAGLNKLGERYGGGWKKAILASAAISIPFALPPTIVAAEIAKALGYAGKQAAQAAEAAPKGPAAPAVDKVADQVEQAAKIKPISLPVIPQVDLAGIAKAQADAKEASKVAPVTIPIQAKLDANSPRVVINAADEMRLAIEKAAGFASIKPFEGLIRQAGQFRESLGLVGEQERVVQDGLNAYLAGLAQAKQNPFSDQAKALERIGLSASALAGMRIDQSLQAVYDGLRKIDDVKLREDLSKKLLGQGFAEVEKVLAQAGAIKLPEAKLELNVRDSAEKAVADLKDVLGGALDKLFSGDFSGAASQLLRGTFGFAKGLVKDTIGQIGQEAAAAFSTGGLPAALEAGASGAASAVEGLSAGLAGLGASIPVIGQIALAVVAVGVAAKATYDYVNKAFSATAGLLKQAQALGETGQRALEVGHAFARAGADIGDVGQNLNRFAKFLGDIRLDPTGSQAQSVRRLGLDAEQLARTPLPEALGRIGDALNGLGDRALQAHFAQEIFGRGWADLQGVFRRGSAGFREASAEYRRFAGVISTVDAERVRSAQRTIQIVASQRAAISQGIQVRTAAAFAPAFENSGKLGLAINEGLRLGGSVVGDFLEGLGKVVSLVSHLGSVVGVGVRGWVAYYQVLYSIGKAIFNLGSPIAYVIKLLSEIASTDAFKDFVNVLQDIGSLITDIGDGISGFFDSIAGEVPGLASDIASVIPGLKEVSQAVKAVIADLSKPRAESQFWAGLLATTPAVAALEISRQRRLQQEAERAAAAPLPPVGFGSNLPRQLFSNTTLRRPDRVLETLQAAPVAEPTREQSQALEIFRKQIESMGEQIQLSSQLRREAERLGYVRVNATHQELEAVKDLVEFRLRNARALASIPNATATFDALARTTLLERATAEAANTAAEFNRQAEELARGNTLMGQLVAQGLTFEQIQRRITQANQVENLRRRAPGVDTRELEAAAARANEADAIAAATADAVRQSTTIQTANSRLLVGNILRERALAQGFDLQRVDKEISDELDRHALLLRGADDAALRRLETDQRRSRELNEQNRLLEEANKLVQANRQAQPLTNFEDDIKKIIELQGKLPREQINLALGRRFHDLERSLNIQPDQLPTQVLATNSLQGLQAAAAQRAGIGANADPQIRVERVLERAVAVQTETRDATLAVADALRRTELLGNTINRPTQPQPFLAPANLNGGN